jgi:hypothetical protein
VLILAGSEVYLGDMNVDDEKVSTGSYHINNYWIVQGSLLSPCTKHYLGR